jgi:hypothetical protein
MGEIKALGGQAAHKRRIYYTLCDCPRIRLAAKTAAHAQSVYIMP